MISAYGQEWVVNPLYQKIKQKTTHK